jgi:hypothetical protein
MPSPFNSVSRRRLRPNVETLESRNAPAGLSYSGFQPTAHDFESAHFGQMNQFGQLNAAMIHEIVESMSSMANRYAVSETVIYWVAFVPDYGASPLQTSYDASSHDAGDLVMAAARAQPPSRTPGGTGNDHNPSVDPAAAAFVAQEHADHDNHVADPRFAGGATVVASAGSALSLRADPGVFLSAPRTNSLSATTFLSTDATRPDGDGADIAPRMIRVPAPTPSAVPPVAPNDTDGLPTVQAIIETEAANVSLPFPALAGLVTDGIRLAPRVIEQTIRTLETARGQIEQSGVAPWYWIGLSSWALAATCAWEAARRRRVVSLPVRSGSAGLPEGDA